MNKFQSILAGIIAIAGLILLLIDLFSEALNMRGADSIAGAILLGAGVIGLQCNGRNRQN